MAPCLFFCGGGADGCRPCRYCLCAPDRCAFFSQRAARSLPRSPPAFAGGRGPWKRRGYILKTPASARTLAAADMSGRSGTQGVLQSRPCVFGLYALPSFPSRGTPRPTSSPFLHKSSCPSISADPESPTGAPAGAGRIPLFSRSPAYAVSRPLTAISLFPNFAGSIPLLVSTVPVCTSGIPVEQIYKQEYT